jgi:isochorismate synthase
MRINRTEVNAGHSVKETLTSVISRAVLAGKSISLWRLPDTDVWNLIVADEARPIGSAYTLEDSLPGFLVSPFDPAGKRYFLPADHLYEIRNESVEQIAGNEDLPSAPVSESLQLHRRTAPARIDGTMNDFERLVQKGIDEISKGSFEKIVPARAQTIELDPQVDLLAVFERLCLSYPQAFVTLTSSDTYGTWMGASPELLVHVDPAMTFRTTAIAATQPSKSDLDLKRVSWTQKEIEEQALVERYIISCFKKIRLREYEEQGPRTVRAGNLLHLKTEFSVDMNATNFPQLGSVMLQLLHPTSAVCGMPLEPSLRFLQQNENIDRRLYTGYLGPVNIHSDTRLFVNLRCMEVAAENKAVLYAGAGVTIDSTPALEWEETVMKMNTLRRVILS